METGEATSVLVQVVPVEDGREISSAPPSSSNSGDRVDDIRQAIEVGAKAVADSVGGLGSPRGGNWGRSRRHSG